MYANVYCFFVGTSIHMPMSSQGETPSPVPTLPNPNNAATLVPTTTYPLSSELTQNTTVLTNVSHTSLLQDWPEFE